MSATSRVRRASFAVLIAAAMLSAGCSGSESPSSSPSPTPSAAASPLLTASPTPTPLPTVLAGEPWGGLVATAPVPADEVIWDIHEHLTWHGQVIGLGLIYDPYTPFVASSTDWAHWTVLARGDGAPNANFLGATEAGLVAAFGGSVWTSTDASNWEPADVSAFKDTPIAGLAAGPLGVVAVGGRWDSYKASIYYSENGSSWKEVQTYGSASKPVGLYGVAAVPGGFVAFGSFDRQIPMGDGWVMMGIPSGTAAAWFSPDGRTWSRATVRLPKDGAAAIEHVYVAAHGLLAQGYLSGGEDAPINAVWSSVDGRTWVNVPVPPTGNGLDGTPPTNAAPAFGQILDDGTRLISEAPQYCPNWQDAWLQDTTKEACNWQPGGTWESLDGVHWHQLRMELFPTWNQGVGYLLPDGMVQFPIVSGQLVMIRVVAVP